MSRSILFLTLLLPLFIKAQTIKTSVLVIGNGDAAYAAALQASKSGVETIILSQEKSKNLAEFGTNMPVAIKNMYTEIQTKKIAYQEFIKLAPKKPEKNKPLKAKIDSAKFLNVMDNLNYTAIKRSGSAWELKLSDAKTLRAKVLILADKDDLLISSLKISPLSAPKINALNYQENLYRTTVAAVNNENAQYLSFYDLLNPSQDNLIFIEKNNIAIGQAAGATAAYAAFFNTKTSEANLKLIQGELLKYKLSLMPLADVALSDPNWMAMQKIGITGIIKAAIKNNTAYFEPEKEVSYQEIKQPIKDYFYKAQIWFDDHQDSPINLENTIALACYVGNKSLDATTEAIKKNWEKSYQFKSPFDLKKTLTRREFSAIISDYLAPFENIKVDKNGRIIR